MPIPKFKKLLWTHHAREKMNYYRLSEQRVRRVLNAPKRVEEGVAPKTVAVMSPASLHAEKTQKENRFSRSVKKPLPSIASERDAFPPLGRGGATWSQEIWVMVQDVPTGRKIISAWRYPGVTKPRSELTKEILRGEYEDFLGKT